MAKSFYLLLPDNLLLLQRILTFFKDNLVKFQPTIHKDHTDLEVIFPNQETLQLFKLIFSDDYYRVESTSNGIIITNRKFRVI